MQWKISGFGDIKILLVLFNIVIIGKELLLSEVTIDFDNRCNVPNSYLGDWHLRFKPNISHTDWYLLDMQRWHTMEYSTRQIQILCGTLQNVFSNGEKELQGRSLDTSST